MRLVLLGSGIFGVPTFEALADRHDVQLVVSQPDRPAGRGRTLQPTPVSSWAAGRGLPLQTTDDVNDPVFIDRIRSMEADAWIVIAFGQKLGPDLLADRFAINLHASLLPRYRGAAPINHAIIQGEHETGLSVITLADRIDAGDVLGSVSTPIEPEETAGVLHDRLSELGPALVLDVLDRHVRGDLDPIPQDPASATPAPKFSRSDGTVEFDLDAITVRNRVHGLTPWPGCDVLVSGRPLRLLSVSVIEPDGEHGPPGRCSQDGRVSCATGLVRLVEVRPPGGRAMDFESWLRGQHDLTASELEVRST